MFSEQHCRISLILPCYNVSNYVERCIQSCLAQNISPSDYEIILVDDGSTDNTAEILLHWAEKHTNILVFRQNNLGLGGARNTGLVNAHGKYVWFIDSDDWIADNCLDELLCKAETEQVDLLYFHAKKLCPNGVEKDYGALNSGGPYRLSECAMGNIELSACIELYRRDFLISRNLRFAEHFLHEDTDFNSRVFAYNPKVYFLQTQYYYYDNRRMNSITNSKGFQMQRDNLMILKRYIFFAQKIVIPNELKKSIFRHLFIVCVFTNFPLHVHFTSNTIQMIKEYKTWMIETANQAKYLPLTIISCALKCSVPLFILSLRLFQYAALMRRKMHFCRF